MENLIRKHLKLIKTCILLFSFLTLGMVVGIFGPCLLDLQRLVNVDTHYIGLIISAKSIGFVVGSLLGGVLLDITSYKQAVLMACNFLLAETFFSIPWNKSVATLISLMVVNGSAGGVINTAGNVLCLQLWGKASGPFIQTLHFLFGVGGFVSPLIAAPFLQNVNGISNNTGNATLLEGPAFNSLAKFSNISNLTQTSESIPDITYPFSILGVAVLLVCILHLMVCIIAPTEDEDLRELEHKNSDRSLLFSCFVVILIFVLFFTVGGVEVGYGHSLATYAVKGSLHATAEIGSYMTSAYWAAYTISRLATIFLSAKISSRNFFVIDISMISTASLILLFLMRHEWAVWLSSVLFGVGISPVFGVLVGWLNDNILLTNKISSVFSLGVVSGEMVIPFVITYFIEDIPDLLPFVMAALCVQMTVYLLLLRCIFQYGKKNKYEVTVELTVTDSSENHNESQANYKQHNKY